MARGVNKVILIGNLGQDPEVRYTTSGTAIASFSVATSESWTDKQSGEKQERTEWHRVKVFGKLAEICGEYLAKGRQVYIEGSIRTEKYTDKAGVEKYATDIIAATMQMLGSNEGGGGGQRPASSGGQQRGRAQDHHTNLDQRGGGTAYGSGGGSRQSAPPDDTGFADDEIPF